MPRGFPCCARFPCVHAVATTPAQRLGHCFAHSPSRISLPRYGCQVGLCNVLFEACSAFTRVAACTLALPPYVVARFTRGFNRLVASTVAPVASGWSGCRVGLSPTGISAAFARRTPEADIQSSQKDPDEAGSLLVLRCRAGLYRFPSRDADQPKQATTEQPCGSRYWNR